MMDLEILKKMYIEYLRHKQPSKDVDIPTEVIKDALKKE